ncbi:uncharacterized protein Ir7b [Drosophila tropicalis]|uniref:uncharacterized protein Ir7b n=1 Tax=Drosophila tropicalis TaxID=46794 RepID=UPI0035ABB87E
MQQISYNLLVISCCLILISTNSRALASAMESTEILAQAMLRILQESDMCDQSKTLFIYTQISANRWHRHMMDITTQLLADLSEPRQLYFQYPIEYKPYRHAMILLVDDLEALRLIFGRLKATSDLSHTLIYMSEIWQPYASEVQSALEMLWHLSVLNVGLILRTVQNNNNIVMVTYYPFSAVHGCQVIVPTIVNRYQTKAGTWASRDYFPAKLGNFYGCTLTCATWEDMPYLVYRQHSDNDVGDASNFIGIEGALLEFLAENLNFTVGLYWMNKEEVLATFNETGWIFEEIFHKHADFSLGGFHFKPSSSGAPVPYSQSSYYFMSHIMLVTNLQSAYSAYEKLAFPFHPRVWLAIGVVIVSMCALIWMAQHLLHPILPDINYYYQLVVITLGGNLLVWHLPRGSLARWLLLIWLFTSLILRSAYQSGMYQMLRKDTQRNPPQTIAEVINNGYTIRLAETNAQRILASLPELRPQQLRYLNGSELQWFPALARSGGNSSRLMAIITPYEYFGYFRKVHPMSRHLHLVKERIFTQQLAFYVRRHSHLVSVLNDQIRHAHAYGFLEHWTRRYVSAVDETDESIIRITSTVSYNTLDGIDGEPQVSENDDDDDDAGDIAPSAHPVKLMVLSMQELAALFWLTLWALLAAVLVFVIELFLHFIQPKVKL